MSSPLTSTLISTYSDTILSVLSDLPDNFLLSDPTLPDHPIIFASSHFLSMSGYTPADVIGSNGRMFQGPKTDRRAVLEIREAIRREATVTVSIVNYKKDGKPYWVLFHLCPVVEGGGRVGHFLAVVVPLNRRRGKRVVVQFAGCRNEVVSSGRCEVFEDDTTDCCRGLEAEELREASDWEKQKATNAAQSILSILAYYRKHTSRVADGKRFNSAGIAPLSSSLNISLGRIKQSFVLTDACLPDTPIVYASDAFLSLTGYSRHEVLGRNCRFLNGPGTDTEVLHQIHESIRVEQACTVCILSYRKDGSSFWNLLHISPVRNATGKIAFYVGVQTDVSCKKDRRGLSPEMKQLSVVATVKVAVRSLSAGPGASSRST